MYDTLILVVGQNQPHELGGSMVLSKAVNQSGKDRHKLYHTDWQFINNLDGILYKIYTPEGLGKFECGDELFEFDYRTTDLSAYNLFGVFSEKVETAKMALRAEYCQEVFSLLESAVRLSPIETILFLCNDVSLQQDQVQGVWNLKSFQSMLISGKVLTNICYIVSQNKK